MFIGYARVSKSDGTQVLDSQIDSLIEFGVNKDHIYTDKASGKKDDRPGLENCLKALREGDTLVVYKIDRLGRSLKHLVSIVDDLSKKNIGFKVLSGQGADIDTTTPTGKMVFSIFATLAEYERELIRERTIAGLNAARARGKVGGRKFNLSKHQVRLAQTAMKNRDTNIQELCKELKISRPTLYKYVSPTGELRDYGKRVLNV